MIGPSAIATAGHCVYDKKYGFASYVEVFPAKNGSTEPYPSARSSNILVSTAYVFNGLVNDDWAVVELNSKVGNQTGWLGLKWQTASYNGQFVYNTGYPTGTGAPSGQNSSNPYMYRGTGYIKESNTYTLKGNWDSTGGNSGGPVFAYYSDTGYTVIGIVTNGSATSTDGSNYPTAFTTATRITETVFNVFKSYQ